MHFTIHRGTKEIGGSCVEIKTDTTRIVLDLGMPLVDAQQNPFDSKSIDKLEADALIKQGVLPDIQGLYRDDAGKTALIVSHAHQDHYGLMQYVHNNCPVFFGEATHKLIELTNIFTGKNHTIQKFHYFSSGKSFHFGDFTITPYLMDHAAFDAYAFLVKAHGKSLFYSGDFRIHGRKANAFTWFSQHIPQEIDYLLMEGATLGRENFLFPREDDLENEFVKQFKSNPGIHLVYVSGQNIDRLVSLYRACKRSGKLLVVDFYIATILKEMAQFSRIPYPSRDFPEIRVFYPRNLARVIVNRGQEKLLYQFRAFKITKEQINEDFNRVVITVRPSMRNDLKAITCLDSGTFIYSMWSGYRKEKTTRDFIEMLIKQGMRDISIHTSGHADRQGLQKMVETLRPKHLVPIHTFNADDYQAIFPDENILHLNDGETVKM